VPRAKLMGNQWHPNDEGGRVMALAILRALGFSEANAARTGDALDVTAYRAITTMRRRPMTPSHLPSRRPPNRHRRAPGRHVVQRNEVVFFAAQTGRNWRACRSGTIRRHGLEPQAQRLYVACEGSGRLDVIKVPGFTAEAPIALGDVYPVAVVLSDDESTAWTGNFFGSSVSR